MAPKHPGENAKPISKTKFGRLITDAIRRMATETVEVGSTGEFQIRATRLAEIAWDSALGYMEKLPDGQQKYHSPQVWAINLVWDRMEGKQSASDESDNTKLTIGDRVGEVAKSRKAMNDLAEKANESE